MKVVFLFTLCLVFLLIGGTAFSDTSDDALVVTSHQIAQSPQNPGPTGNAGGIDSGSGNDGGTNVGTGAAATSAPNNSNASTKVSAATQTYATAAAMGDLLEIETSKLALSHAKSADVKAFAKEMIQQHGELLRKFKATVMKNHLDIHLPTILDKDHRQILDGLKKTAAADFDKAYLTVQKKAHDEALNLHQQYAESGDEQTLKTEAGSIATVVKAHIEHLRKVSEELKIAL